MRYLLILLIAVFLSSCSSKPVRPPDVQPEPLWRILRLKEAGKTRLDYKDKWFAYKVDFKYLGNDPERFRNTLYGQCPIEKARLMVVDKYSGEAVLEETITQTAETCGRCHKL